MTDLEIEWSVVGTTTLDRESGVDPETLLTGGLSYGAIFSIIDGTNYSQSGSGVCRSVNLVFISFSVQ